MTQTPQKPRCISPEIYNHLDSVERLIAQQLILEGKWILKEPEGQH